MNHSEFVDGWKSGKIAVDVDRSKALKIASSKVLPKRYQTAHMFWSWVWMLSIPAAFALMYFYTWWAGLLSLVVVTPTLSNSTKKSAMQFMIDHSVENPEFYELAVAEGVLRVQPKP